MAKSKKMKPENEFAASMSSEDTQPKPEMNPEVDALLASDSEVHDSPTLEPAEGGVMSQDEMRAGAWGAKKLNGLWVSNHNKNAYISIVGVGWTKLSDANANGINAMFKVAAAAKQKNKTLHYRKENDNKIHELYCW